MAAPTRTVLLRWAAAWLLVACGCSKKSEEGKPTQDGAGPSGPLASGVLAQVGTSRLTEADLQRVLPPDLQEGVTGGEIRDILDRWVRTELLYQKAMRDGLRKDPQVDARIHELERDLLADELLQRELANRVRVGSDELQAWYRAHQAEYTQEVHLQHIVLNSREEADEVMEMLRSGAGFEALARQRSTDATAPRGGELGFLGKGAMNPAFEPFVFGASPGEIVGPIATTFGFHVVRVVARRPASDPISFDAARDEIMHALLLQKQQAAQTAFLQELQKGAQVQVAKTYAGMSLDPEARPADAPARSFLASDGQEATAPPPPRNSVADSLQNDRD